MSRVVIIQGPTTNYSQLKNKWGDNLIWSTWKGEESHYSDQDEVIFNIIPNQKGTQNVNLQKISTLSGLYKAKELGYTRAVKTRSDLYPTNYSKLTSLFKKGLNITFFHNHRQGYYVDYIFEGNIDLLIKCFSFEDTTPFYAEQVITKNINKIYSKQNIYYYGNLLNKNNDLFWIKKNLYLSNYNSIPKFITK
jgi:hypothetical protein